MPRKWTVTGAIREIDVAGCYYLDLAKQNATKSCIEAVEKCQLVLLPGARASGKTTRLHYLRKELGARDYLVLM